MSKLLSAIKTISDTQSVAARSSELMRISTYLMGKAKEYFSTWEDARAETLRLLSREFELEAEIVFEDYQKLLPEQQNAERLIDDLNLEATWKPLEWVLTKDKQACFSLEYSTLILEEPQPEGESKITIFELEGTGTYSFCRLEKKEEK